MSSAVINLLSLAIKDAELREKFLDDFDGTLASMEFQTPLTDEEKKILRNAFEESDVEGQCSPCSYDMSCGYRGYA